MVTNKVEKVLSRKILARTARLADFAEEKRIKISKGARVDYRCGHLLPQVFNVLAKAT